MRERDDDLIVAVDIGSSKVVVAIAAQDEDTGELSVIGLGSSGTNTGVKEGCIVNINTIMGAITEAINQAEMQAGREVRNVFVAEKNTAAIVFLRKNWEFATERVF